MSPNNQKSGMLLGLEFSSVKKCNNNELKSQPREGILGEGGGVCSFHLVAKKKKITTSIKDPHTLKVWNSSELSVCAYPPVLQILTLFHTKPCHSPQPFSADLASEKCTWFANPSGFSLQFWKKNDKICLKIRSNVLYCCCCCCIKTQILFFPPLIPLKINIDSKPLWSKYRSVYQPAAQ